MAGAEEFDARAETQKLIDNLPKRNGTGKIKPGFFGLLSPILRARTIYNFSDLVEVHIAGSGPPVKGDFSEGGDDKEFLLRGEEEQLEDLRDMDESPSATTSTTTTPWARVFVWDEWMSDKSEEDMDKVCRGLGERLYKLKDEKDVEFIGFKTSLDEEGNDVRLACVHYPFAQLEIIYCFQPAERKWLIDAVSPLISSKETEKEIEQWHKNVSSPFSLSVDEAITRAREFSSSKTPKRNPSQWTVVEQVSANQSTHKLATGDNTNNNNDNNISDDDEENEDYWGRYDRVKTIADASSSSSGEEQDKYQYSTSTRGRKQPTTKQTSSTFNNDDNAYRIHVQETMESLYKLGSSQGIEQMDLVELLISNVLSVSKQQKKEKNPILTM